MSGNLIIRQLGLQPYEQVSLAMHRFTKRRTSSSADEIWLVQHPKIFTQGQAGKPEHLLTPSNIPVIQSDRGGQITYHGPGQQIMYVMLDLRRRKLGARNLVMLLEQTVVSTLSRFSIDANARNDAPGVYVNDEKICSIGLRIQKGCSFHGLALNITMDLSPFLHINPCGYVGLRMIQISELVPSIKLEDVVPVMIKECLALLGDQAEKIFSWNFDDYLR